MSEDEESREKIGIDPFFYAEPGKGIDPFFYAEPGEGIDPLFHVVPDNEVPENSLYMIPMGREEAPQVKAHMEVCRSKEEQPCLQGFVKAGIGNDVEEKTESFATNFIIKPIKKRIYVDRKGDCMPELEVIESVLFLNNEYHKIEIKTKEIHSLTKIITKKFSDAIIDCEQKNAEKNIEIKFRNETRFCKKEFIYYEQGWQKIAGKPVYVRDDLTLGEGVEIRTGATLPALPCNTELLQRIVQRAFMMYQEQTIAAVMLTFSCLGVLYRLFKDAGFPPHFTLFIHGKTGSMKTTVAKILYTQVCADEYRDTVRRIDSDTAVSLERGITSAGYDTITLIDDFSPAKTNTKKREMTDKLEMVIRMVGDGSSRSRSNIKLEDCRGEGVQGMVVLTGELTGKGLSSNLRCLYCKMKKEQVNSQIVAWFQENPSAYTTFVAAFADYVSNNYSSTVSFIRERFSEERKYISYCLKENRLIDSAATLCITADILREFLTACCGMSFDETKRLAASMKAGIIDCTQVSQEISSEESPGMTFVQAIYALMRTNKIHANADKIRMAEVSEYDGFQDDTFLYFNPDIIHKKVVAFLQQTNKYFPYEMKEVLAMLADDGIIKTASNGTGKRTFCTRISVGNGAKQNFLKIRKTIFYAICEGNYDCEKGEKE